MESDNLSTRVNICNIAGGGTRGYLALAVPQILHAMLEAMELERGLVEQAHLFYGWKQKRRSSSCFSM
jgi:hypothetical protein